MPLSLTQRIEVLMIIGYGDRVRTQKEVCVLFNNKYPEMTIFQSTLSRIENKFRETGSVDNLSKSGRPSVSEEAKTNIFLSFEENPHNSVRQVGREYNVSKSCVHSLLRLERWHPYKMKLVQELSEDDPDRRMQFCQILMDRCNNDPLFVKRIIFSDESTFTLNGEVNRQNVRYWSNENPRWMRESHTQYPQKINVWAGIVENRIIGPYFFDDTLTGIRYLQFLQTYLIPTLRGLFPNRNNPEMSHENLWYQQDGAPPHYAVYVRRFLDQVFPGKWIGRRGSIEWPPRSPDLTPLDFFLWGHLKNVVFKTKPDNLEELKNRIRRECDNISRETISRVQEEFINRLGFCQAQEGFQFEHFIK
ncbi:uncharacterized protein LOC115881550 [Sitophilus oryzae]|uniref:Uncharacterized protein LOC115881550 n=1 Tax=Sitophilus oryzae TaxID=7048 RepID=A0A6J2XWF2_SITOR|nr:uncharacterized protein LOC115881550 [Sitophilus oryzae]